jgi:hypothetical protein
MGIYIKKSKTFLWPLVNINIKPIETYLFFGDIDTSKKKLLIVLFHNKNPDYISIKSKIEMHPYYDFTFTDDEFDIVTFNFYKIRNDFDKVVAGKYSEISQNFKNIISTIEKNKIVLKCLDPENNYLEFAKILEIHDFELKGKELLSPPKIDAETLFVKEEIKNKIIENYGLTT